MKNSGKTMIPELSPDSFWESAPSGKQAFQRDQIAGLPEAARSYLEHEIDPGTLLASAVRLRMHGENKLRGEQSVPGDKN